MADPFYQKAPTPVTEWNWTPVQAPVNNNPTPVQVSPEQIKQQVDQINQQQLLLQQQYAQWNIVLQNPQANAQQKQEATAKMQELSGQYENNAKLLQGLNGNRVNKPVQVKAWRSKISMRWILMWCGILTMLVVWWLVAVFYFLMQNPTQLSSVWLDATTTKTLLQTFTAVFFGLLVFGGLALTVVNLYRIITVKNQPKLRFWMWALFWFIILIISITFGSQVLTLVNNMTAGTNVNANNLLIGYLSWSTADIANDPNLNWKLIAPSAVYYVLNNAYFTDVIAPTLWGANVTDIKLDCWNWQTLSMLSNYQFAGNCMYLNKWEYPLTLVINYVNLSTSERLSKSVSWWNINFLTQISIVPASGPLTYNDSNTEMIAGKNPAKISFDATEVFRDFSLSDYNVIWYVTDDGVANGNDIANFTYVYTGAKLYNIKVRFPKLNNFLYTFPLRIEQSDVPVCEVAYESLWWNKYSLSTSFYDNTSIITEYLFNILDKKNNSKVIDTIKSENGSLQYELPGWGLYAAKVVFLTSVGKQWECESQNIQVWASDFDVLYNVNYKSIWSPQFKPIWSDSWVTLEGDTISIKEIPTIIQINIASVSPNSPTATKKVLYDGNPVISSDGKNWDITVNTSDDHIISIVVDDFTRWAKTQKDLNVKINRSDIIWKLIVKPDTVGTDPFDVTFDASTTTLNDSDDEIVYFSWDFGDGEIKKNLSQSIITHTYRYNTKEDSWEYSPVLTIKTKKGREVTISPDNNIIVKKALSSLKINVISHPAQIANIWDRVNYQLDVNWLPDKITWDFGNGKTLECNWRDCVQATTMYDAPGTYTVKAKVTYPDQPLLEWNISIKVN